MPVTWRRSAAEETLTGTVTPLLLGYELTHFHYITTWKSDAVAYICNGYVVDNVHCEHITSCC